ncbi:hypothetical protein HDK77DRAFT_476342 [Phyllosticta capitalensis]|uniref:Uncharacterized protein n=1 Tax=Phyllosticta capitalensis TaxID=121624 RepID=A0ABR1YR41_9PEZI
MAFGGLGKSGGLTINTGNTPSPFGSTTSQPQSTGLGGAPAAGGSLFGTGAATNNTGGSLFGQNKPATTTAGGSLLGGNTATSGLFGAGAAASTTGGNPFGSTNTATSAAGGGPFGSGTTATSQPQQQQTGGLFGNAQTNQSTAPSLFGNSATQNKPSLFASSTTNTSQPQQSAFGGAMNNQQQQGGGGLFGTGGASTNQPSTGLGGSLFGQRSTAPNQSTSAFGTGLLGGASTNQQTVPGVRIDLSNIRGSTRFSDLHDDLQREIEKYDQFIQDQIQAHDKCAAFIDGSIKESLSYLPSDVEFVNTKVEAVETALDNDSQAIASLKETFKLDAENARIAFRVIENLKLPAQYHYSGSMWNPVQQPIKAKSDTLTDTDDNTDLVAYFASQAKDLDKTLETQARLLMEIEQHLRTVESTTMQQLQESMARGNVADGVSARESRLRELAQLFQEIQKAILFEAQKVGDCREKVVEASVGQAGGPWRR